MVARNGNLAGKAAAGAKAAPSAASRTAHAVRGAASVASDTAKGSSPAGKSDTGTEPVMKRYSDLETKEDKNKAVGGDPSFIMGVYDMTTGDFDKNFTPMVFELPPARASFHEKQGQSVPGAGAGMVMTTRTNTARLPIPGAKPMIQNMGLGKETISWVGAFVGFDQYTRGWNKKDNGQPAEPAIDEAYRLFEQFRKQRQILVKLGWSTSAGATRVSFGTSNFVGYIKDIKRVASTESRVYYQLLMVVTNALYSNVTNDPVDFNPTDLQAYPLMEQFYSTEKVSPTFSSQAARDTDPVYGDIKLFEDERKAAHVTEEGYYTTVSNLREIAKLPVNKYDIQGAKDARATFNSISSTTDGRLRNGSNFNKLYRSAEANVNNMLKATGIQDGVSVIPMDGPTSAKKVE